MCIIYRIFKVVAFNGSGHVKVAVKIYDEFIADHSFSFETAVVGAELHTFKFYCSYFFVHFVLKDCHVAIAPRNDVLAVLNDCHVAIAPRNDVAAICLQ